MTEDAARLVRLGNALELFLCQLEVRRGGGFAQSLDASRLRAEVYIRQ